MYLSFSSRSLAMIGFLFFAALCSGSLVVEAVDTKAGRVFTENLPTNSMGFGPTATPCSTPGSLDLSFDGDGKVNTPIGTGVDSARAVAIQADGKIVVGGNSNSGATNFDFAVVRYNTDGSLDTSFDGDGKVVTPVSPGNVGDSIYAIAIQTDGRIVAAGNTGNGGSEIALVRYNTDGSLDTSFDGDGKVITSGSSGAHYCYALALQPDGRIIIAGGGVNFSLVRYNTDGSLDTSFDGDGVVVTSLGAGANSDGAFAVTVQPDGKIIAAGNRAAAPDITFAVARYNPDGSLDTSFDNDGLVFTSIHNEDDALSVAVQTDGKIVVGGLSFIDFGVVEGVALVRYNPDGSLDASFDGDGKVLTPGIGYLNSWAAPIAIQPDGSIVVATSIPGATNYDFGAARYMADGSLDGSFGKGGKVITPLTNDDVLFAVAIQPDGPIVTTGMTGPNYNIGVVRYNGGCDAVAPKISGTVSYGNAIGNPTQRVVSNVRISGAGSPDVVALSNFPSGFYFLTGFGAGPYQVTPDLTGQVNGAITSFDAARITQHVAGVSILTGNAFVVADVSGDGTLSSFDAGQVARYVTGVSGFGSTASWRFDPTNRTYASVVGNISGEDYSALLMGEVSGNWTNTGSRAIGRRLEKGSSQNLEAGLSDGGNSPMSSYQLSKAMLPTVIAQEVDRRASEKYSRSDLDSPHRTAEPSYSQGSVKEVAVEIPFVADSVGKMIVVPLNIKGVANKGIISYEFDLRYDPSVIEPTGDVTDVKGTASRGLVAVTNSTEPGLLRIVVYGAYPIDADGVLLNLRFTAVGKSGSVSPLSFERIMFNEGEPRVSTTSGQVELL